MSLRYRAFGHVIASECALPELPPAATEPDDLRVVADPGAAPPARWNAGGSRAQWRLGRAAGGFVLRCPGLATYFVDADARLVRVHRSRRRLASGVRHLLVDQVLPLAFAQQGSLVLHASGIVVDGRSIALLGPSGTGKSTLAGQLARGGRLLADDALVVRLSNGGVEACPAYPGLRVWPDVLAALGGSARAPRVAPYSRKRRLAATPDRPFEPGTQRLHRLYVVDPVPSPDIRLIAMGRRDVAVALLAHAYVLDPVDATRLGRQLDQACAVAARLEVRRLTYPRSLASLASVCQAIRVDARR